MADETLSQGLEKERRRAQWTTRLLLFGMLLDAAAILSGLSQLSLLRRMASGESILDAEISSNDGREGAIGMAQLVVFLITAVLFLRWLHAAYSNLQRAGTRTSEYSPGWAVGYWFIPFVNLVRPYQIAKELWWRSERSNSYDTPSTYDAPALLGWWWGIYIISGILGRILLSQAGAADTLPELMSLTRSGIGLDLVSIVSALLALRVIQGISQRQQAWGDAAPALVLTVS